MKATLRGLVYIKHVAVGTRSEVPGYFLQTVEGDYKLRRDDQQYPWGPDYRLESYARSMVEVTGVLLDDELEPEAIKPFISESGFLPKNGISV